MCVSCVKTVKQIACLFHCITNTNRHDSLHVFLSSEFKLENFGQHLEISLSTKGKKIVTRVHQDVVDKSKLFLLQVTLQQFWRMLLFTANMLAKKNLMQMMSS